MQQHIISSNCSAIPTVKSFKSFSSFKLTFIISLILLSTLIEAVPTPFSSSFLNKRNDNPSNDDLKTFADFAAAAYCQSSFFPKWNCGLLCNATNGTVVTFIATHEENKLIVVSFRGTVPDNIKTVITDAKFLFTDYPPAKDAKVHTGFYQAFLETQSDVFNEVQNLHKQHPDFKVLYTGHSLGGALTLLSALDLVQNSTSFIPNKNFFVVTYGQPRVGNSVFSKYVDKTLKVTRVTNGDDPVPHLPPQFVGYEHHSGELWISDPEKSTSAFVTCNGPEDPKCSDSVAVNQLNANFHMGPYFGVSMRACNAINQQSLNQLTSGLGVNKLQTNI
ncbi:Alpha/Beta hydrolase protein [Glomus cerebriforme]|uniref:Alpha/Beta hydrolase protein n=1 Tax=Glomus cerebriforme TaxID=658196 RepID=A0A397THD1_9GLOM|nr:Alpha/Beta hydrolase protein [Glomus cerebriforme]